MAKIDRALIIRRLGVELSQEYAKGCAESCEEHDLPYEFIDAVEFLSCEEAFTSVGAKKSPNYSNGNGHCCCHASHIKSWKRIIELDKPCLILEHDSIVRGDVRNIDLPELGITTFGHRVTHKNVYTPIKPAEEFLPIKRAIGTHAVGLTPQTAKWLWEDARDNGISVGIDKYLMMLRKCPLDLYVCSPEQVVCWTRGSTIGIQDKKSQGQHKIKMSASNYKEAFSPYWLRGF